LDNKKNKTSGAVPPADPHLAGTADAFGIVYRPYGKKKQEYDVPSGPAFEDEAEFERDLLSSEVLKPAAAQTEDDDEFDFEISQSKTFLVSSQLPAAASSALGGLRLTTLGGGDESFHLDGESSGEEDEDEREVPDDSLASVEGAVVAEGPPAAEIAPLSTRDAARLALAEITGIYSSGLGDHEVTILNSSGSSSEMTTKELSLLAKLGVKNSAIEEIDEEELEKEEEREVQEERQLLSQQEAQQTELESQWAAVDSTVRNMSLAPSGDEESSYQVMTYKEALAVFR
jgi:hypothetical protein